MDAITAAAAIRQSWRDAVADLIKIGATVTDLADLWNRYGYQGFPEFCGNALGIPHPDALLLARWAADRPGWVDPAAVDLSDPLATEVLEMAMRHTARKLGIACDGLATEEVA
jgi:hypothetical protein